MAKAVTCKRCGEDGLTWISDLGRWKLTKADPQRLMMTDHRCKEGPRPTTCKDCGANDLHWFQNHMEDGSTRWTITESYGLPHACDERRKKQDDAKQKKRDFYAKEKERITADPNIPEQVKKLTLHRLRMNLWPQYSRGK